MFIKLPVMKLSFGQWLKLRRDVVNISQAKIADSLGVRAQTISNWEKGVSKPNLTPDQTQILCSELNVSFEELVKAYREEVSLVDS